MLKAVSTFLVGPQTGEVNRPIDSVRGAYPR
jgi:hypothetical protein